MTALSVMQLRPHLKSFSLEIEKELHSLWDVLATFKQVKEGKFNAEEVVHFQYRLVQVLHKVSQYYNLLSNTRKAVRKHQKKLGAKEYYKQNTELNSLIEFVNLLLVISRSLGDAFAFTFYSLDREYLNKHLAREPESLVLPAGVGGQGEIEFVKNFKMIDGNLVLYHGITNILRIGDFSLFNLHEKKVTAVGELKSGRPDEKSLNLNLTIIGPKQRLKQFGDRQDIGDAKKQSSPFTFPNEERYAKQVKAMKDSFNYLDKPNFPDEHLDNKLFSKPKNIVLEELSAEPMDKAVVFSQVDRGFSIARWVYTGESIFDRWENAEDIQSKIDADDVQTNYIKILNSKIDNEVIYGQLHFGEKFRIQQAIGSKPIFWNDINIDVLKKIYFGEVVFMTMYNVGYLMDEMKQRGYVLEYDETLKETCFIKRSPEINYVVSGLIYFSDMVTKYLQDESAVIQSIERVAEATINLAKDGKKTSKVSLNIIMQ